MSAVFVGAVIFLVADLTLSAFLLWQGLRTR